MCFIWHLSLTIDVSLVRDHLDLCSGGKISSPNSMFMDMSNNKICSNFIDYLFSAIIVCPRPRPRPPIKCPPPGN